ncbi:hypothetical protein B0H17DRAFT_1040734 [Mycena rosella]|uniref:Secreted protein n=1 Tax=Mycena rosella TaxID=1033263 RepID=A0AAD7DZS0_MYCRO|nr:hypothetical protein B0H17DRAFT_1040734 [Mycena rosella]
MAHLNLFLFFRSAHAPGTSEYQQLSACHQNIPWQTGHFARNAPIFQPEHQKTRHFPAPWTRWCRKDADCIEVHRRISFNLHRYFPHRQQHHHNDRDRPQKYSYDKGCW